MPDEYSEDDLNSSSLEVGQELSERIMRDVERSLWEDAPGSARERLAADTVVPVGDVVVHISRFVELRELHRDFGQLMPAMRVDDEHWVPVDIHDSGVSPMEHARPWGWWRYGPYPDFMHLWSRREKHWKSDRLTFVDPEEATGTVRRLLASFLGWRHSALFKQQSIGEEPRDQLMPGSAGAVGPYLTITVSCHNPGLAVSMCPVYFGTWTYFGAPTTPVVGSLTPGRYLFGARGPLLAGFVQDPHSYRIPPTLNPVLTAF